ncbi:HigA family addiction module antidote protein [Oxalobacter sp. OttesenSCG-928-P03]|nr:HigA family addiction module antidote protein [Oxalobacter sp. OttesenSCG-928-P03]
MTRKPTHPGELLKVDYLEPLNLTVTELAKRLGVSRKTLSSIINERAGITPEMALRLSRAFSTSAELWLNMQKSYDLWIAEHESTEWQNVAPISMIGQLA